MQTVENNNSSFTYDNSKSVAENILHNNVWFVEKFGSVQFGPKNEIDWSSDPFKNRSWLWLFIN